MYRYESLLAAAVAKTARLEHHQVLLPGHPDHGAYVPPESPTGSAQPDHTHTSRYLAIALGAFLAEGSPRRGDPNLREGLLAAIAFLVRRQRPEGLIDLVVINYASPPDTAFVVQLLTPWYEVARDRAQEIPGAADVASALAGFLRPAALGIIGRGFHTPNHRWVIAAALVRARLAFPDLTRELSTYPEALLAEGIDINADGDFSERSPGIYHAVSNRALRHLADGLDRPDLLDLVRRNLTLCAALLHPDGTIVTTHSTRQDRGQQVVPGSLADSFHDLACRDQNGEWLAVADLLVAAADDFDPWWLISYLQSRGDDEPAREAALPSVRRTFLASGLFRRRQGALSATIAAHSPDFLALRWGALELRSVRLAVYYSPQYLFSPDALEQRGEHLILPFNGARRPAPGYELPLPETVGEADWEEVKKRRERWTLPPMRLAVEVHEQPAGFDLRLCSEGGLEEVLGHLEFSLVGPGEWETSDQAVPVHNGQTALLKAGSGIFHHHGEALEIGPASGGDLAHRLRVSRVYAPDLTAFRVILPLRTPLDNVFSLRWGEFNPVRGFLPTPL